ncbi:hypothetical protein RYX36_008997, partial [Vicia faba]
KTDATFPNGDDFLLPLTNLSLIHERRMKIWFIEYHYRLDSMEVINIVLYFCDMLYDVQSTSQSIVISLIKISIRVHNKKVFQLAFSTITTLFPCCFASLASL